MQTLNLLQDQPVPIKPENKARYPKDWKQIRERILLRALNCCEVPGCGLPNYSINPRTGSKVVLTIAHLDHQPENCADDNLMAMCQQHHLAYDHEHHQQNAYQTRRDGKAVDCFSDTSGAADGRNDPAK
jgi:hypothetical protein